MTDGPRTFENLKRPIRKPDEKAERVSKAVQKIATQPDGQIFLDWMRNRTTFRVLGPDVTDGALRGAEANRQLMQEIESMIASVRRRKSGAGK